MVACVNTDVVWSLATSFTVATAGWLTEWISPSEPSQALMQSLLCDSSGATTVCNSTETNL